MKSIFFTALLVFNCASALTMLNIGEFGTAAISVAAALLCLVVVLQAPESRE